MSTRTDLFSYRPFVIFTFTRLLYLSILKHSFSQVVKYNFSNVTNGNLAKSKIEAVINAESGRSMGDALLVEVLKRKHGFQQYLSDKKDWVQKLEKILEDEVYIVGTIVKQLSEEASLPVKMKLFLLSVLGSQKLNEIQKKWVALSSQNVMDSVESFVRKENRLSLFRDWLMNRPFSSSVEDACFKSCITSWTADQPVMLQDTAPITKDHTVISYGDAVRSWLYSKQGPGQYGLLLSGQLPDNIIVKSLEECAAGCFLGETFVLLCNSKSVAIETLKENDKVLGRDGSIGVVSSEKVVHKLEDSTAIFGFNESKPFFTAGHPFWTQDGWRAVNPRIANSENSGLDVGQLAEGDYVRKVKNVKNGQIDYEWEKVESIHFNDYPAGTKVFGVHTREGPRSYHANGYLVYMYYPEKACKTTAEGMESLSVGEKRSLQRHMDELEPVLKKVLGDGPAKAMKSITRNYVGNRQTKEKRPSKEKIVRKDFSLPHINLQHQGSKTTHGTYSMPKKLSVVRGHVFLDEEHVPDAQISDDNKITWTRTVTDGKSEHGSVKIHGNLSQGHGFVALTNSRNDTKSELSANVVATAHVNKYNCYRSSDEKTTSTQTFTNWVDFGELEMGVDCSSGSCKTVGTIRIPPMDTLDSLGDHVVFGVDATQQLTVSVPIPSDYWSYLGYTKLSGTFSMDFASFTGTCVKYDATKANLQGATYAWKGTIEKNLATEAMIATARNTDLNSSIHAVSQPAQYMSDSISGDAVDGSAEDSVSSAAPMAMTLATMTDEQLSVDELYMITPPDPQAIHELTFSLLQEGMKYEMDSNLREKILGVVKPDFSGDLASVADTYKTFLSQDFANAYLMYGLAQSDHYKDKITDEQRDKLLYYWAGSDTGCLACDSNYNNVNDEFSRVAYIQSCPDVDKYVKSSEGGEYWAEQLYAKLNETSVLNGLALAAEVTQTMTIIQKQSMVLYCLAPSKDYGPQFYKKVLVTRLNEMTSYFDGSNSTAEEMTEIFSDIMHQLVLKILAGGDSTTQELNANLSKQLNDAATELNSKMTETNEQIANDVSAHFANFISEVINLYVAKSGQAWDKLVSSIKEWQESNPIKAGIAKFFGVTMCSALWISGIYFTIKTFMDWKNLEPEQKVQLIADSVDIALRTFSGIPDFIENFQTSCKNGKIAFNFIKDKISARKQPEVAQEMEEKIDKNVEQIESKCLKLLIDQLF